MRDQHRARVPGPDRGRCVPDVQQERRTADRGSVHPARHDAERMSHLDGPRRADGRDPVDVLDRQASVGERVERGLGVQLQRGVVGQLPDPVGLSGASDDDPGHRLPPDGIARERRKQRQADIAALLEGDLQRHVEHEVLRGVRHADQVGHHPRSLGELDDRDRIRCLILEPRRRPVVDHVRVQRRLPARGEPLHPRRAAGRTDRARVEVRLAAVNAPLDPQLASRAAVPERLRIRCRHRHRLAWSALAADSPPRLPAELRAERALHLAGQAVGVPRTGADDPDLWLGVAVERDLVAR